MYTCMDRRTDGWICVCMFVCMSVCLYVRKPLYTHIHTYKLYDYVHLRSMYIRINIYIYTHTCMHACMHAYMHIYIYILIYLFVYAGRAREYETLQAPVHYTAPKPLKTLRARPQTLKAEPDSAGPKEQNKKPYNLNPKPLHLNLNLYSPCLPKP